MNFPLQVKLSLSQYFPNGASADYDEGRMHLLLHCASEKQRYVIYRDVPVVSFDIYQYLPDFSSRAARHDLPWAHHGLGQAVGFASEFPTEALTWALAPHVDPLQAALLASHVQNFMLRGEGHLRAFAQYENSETQDRDLFYSCNRNLRFLDDTITL